MIHVCLMEIIIDHGKERREMEFDIHFFKYVKKKSKSFKFISFYNGGCFINVPTVKK